ncbi:MAG: flavodoxin [Oscillospiraceae bacterium]
MKRTVSILLSLLTILSLSGCGNSASPADQDDNSANVSAESISQTEETTLEEIIETEASQLSESANSSDMEVSSSESAEDEGSNILIAYFTYGENAELPADVDASATASIRIFNGEVTGNTGVMAHMIAEASGGELFSIRTAEPYSDNYNDTIDVGEDEKNNNIRPELSSHIEDLEQYDTIFVGFPNWWYGMPMVMYSFFDEYDFSGKTIIPFCTSGGSAFSDAIDEIRNMEPDATVLDGLHISGSGVSDVENEVNDWVNELGL